MDEVLRGDHNHLIDASCSEIRVPDVEPPNGKNPNPSDDVEVPDEYSTSTTLQPSPKNAASYGKNFIL